MKYTMKTLFTIFLCASASIAAAGANKEPVAVDTTAVTSNLPTLANGLTQVSLGNYTVSAPAGVLQRQSDNQLVAFLPDGSFGMSVIEENVRPKKKEMLALAQGMAKELNLNPEKLRKTEQKGLSGWWISGRSGQEIITAMIVNHDTELLKIIILEKENLKPVGPDLIATLVRN